MKEFLSRNKFIWQMPQGLLRHLQNPKHDQIIAVDELTLSVSQ